MPPCPETTMLPPLPIRGGDDFSAANSGPRFRRIRIIHFCTWADRLQDGAEFLAGLPDSDLRRRVSNPADPELMRLARLDCDWHGEHVRAFGAMRHEQLEFLPAQVVGVAGAAQPLATPTPPGEERWFVITAQHPQMLGATAGRLLAAYARNGIRTLFYAFDEASRTMPCFAEIAPHLAVLIHDERPLAAGAARLRADCLIIHRSWVANVVPFAAPFVAEPEARILFVGSQMGLTANRQRQIEFLRRRYGDRFQAICDHSLPVGERGQLLGRFKVGLCPEGRKFDVPAMSATHTDRPFWSGCLGLVPVSEDSVAGGRLEELHRRRLIQRYAHGDLDALAAACDRALATPAAERRRIYDHFNRHETVGSVVADAIAATGA